VEFENIFIIVGIFLQLGAKNNYAILGIIWTPDFRELNTKTGSG